jgi:anti-sigma-K factor RskA
MSDPRRFTSEDLALFAMQLLSKEEAAEISAYLEQSEDARRELAEIQGDLAIYAHTVDMQQPPPQTRERLMKQIAREKKAIPIDRPATPEATSTGTPTRSGTVFADAAARIDGAKNSGYRSEREPEIESRSIDSIDEEQPKRSVAGKVLPWIGWAAAAGLALTTGNLYRERDALRSEMVSQASKLDHLTADTEAARRVLDTMTDSSAMRVTLNKGQTSPLPQGRATYVASKGTLIFLANNLEPLQTNKIYELWLIPAATGGAPIPAGTFRPDERGNASVIMPPLPKGVEAKAFGVTVENEGGATTPTMPIILVGA